MRLAMVSGDHFGGFGPQYTDSRKSDLFGSRRRDDVGAANRNFFRFWAQYMRCGTNPELHNLCTTSCFPTSPESDKSRIGTGYEHP